MAFICFIAASLPAGKAGAERAWSSRVCATQADLRELKLDVQTFGTKFDVVLIDPPWEEYARRAPGIDIATWTWQEIMKLEIEAITDTPCFLFLW